MSSKKSFNKTSFAQRAGLLSGKMIGGTLNITEASADFALTAMNYFSRGNSNSGFSFAMKALKAKVQKLERSLTIPYAQDAHELSAQDQFAKSVGKGVTLAREKKPQKTLARGAPKLAPT
jgi:hypothetical protein